MIRIELFGDLSRASAHRLSRCLDQALETGAENLILDLRGLDRLEPQAGSPILIAALIADSEHRELLLIPGRDSVQRVLNRLQGPVCYLHSDDDWSLGYDLGWPGAVSEGRQQAQSQRRIVDLLLAAADRLIAAVEHAPEPIRTLECIGANVLLSALELRLASKFKRRPGTPAS